MRESIGSAGARVPVLMGSRGGRHIVGREADIRWGPGIRSRGVVPLRVATIASDVPASSYPAFEVLSITESCHAHSVEGSAAAGHGAGGSMERDERVRERQRLTYMDVLTGLPNRGQFNQGQIANLFLLHRKHLTAADHRKLRFYAIATWRQITMSINA